MMRDDVNVVCEVYIKSMPYTTYRAVAELVVKCQTIEELDARMKWIKADQERYPDSYDEEHLTYLRNLCRTQRQLIQGETNVIIETAKAPRPASDRLFDSQ